ncbi:hypothetical protein VTK26DRAFT_8468 [Humicola hyalothermophila]
MSPVDINPYSSSSLLPRPLVFTHDRQQRASHFDIQTALPKRDPSPPCTAKLRVMSKPPEHGKAPLLEGSEGPRVSGSVSTVCNEESPPDAVVGGQELGDPDCFKPCYTKPGSDLDQPVPRSAKPFQRWVRTLQKRAAGRQGTLGCDGTFSPCCLNLDDGNSLRAATTHHKNYSSSDSSFDFVTAARSASISLGGVSLLTRSRRNTIRSSQAHSRTERSSRASASGARLSEDSYCRDRDSQILADPAVTERALHRRQILEELIDTEESYIQDVRFLMNVYVTILASLPSSPPCLRSSVNQNLADIVELHEEILEDIRCVVHGAEWNHEDVSAQHARSNPSLRRVDHRASLDAVPEGRRGDSWSRDILGLLAEPQTAANVAKLFLERMDRFFLYEEYGAKYELMIKDVAEVHRAMPGWPSYQKGLEVFAASMGSAKSRLGEARKSLTIADLLVKPVQRVCKYPLLFSELLKHTPVVDCPYSHMEIENTLVKFREATGEINRATDDPRIKTTLEKTWILQDRLAFPNQQVDAVSKSRIRSFGQIQLCGALHVCWQTKEGVDGRYMVALLYRHWLCLATAGSTDQVYTIQACIALENVKVEEVDNGRGLQCHTARHSWKIVFLSDHHLYELILTACSPKEEVEWRARLKNPPRAADADDHEMQPEAFSFLALNIRSLGTVFRKPGTLARRLSIHRATTVGPRTTLCQVILKNTSAIRETTTWSNGSRINRSQSLLTTNTRIPVLAPSRGERARLETLLSDVWTRDVLPFPGITARLRSEQRVRASASSMMRKLSGVSIANGFSRRSPSLAGLQPKEKGRTDEKASAVTQMTTITTTHDQEQQEGCMSPVMSTVADREEQRRNTFLQGKRGRREPRSETDYGTGARHADIGNGSCEPVRPYETNRLPRSSTTSVISLERRASFGYDSLERSDVPHSGPGEGVVVAASSEPTSVRSRHSCPSRTRRQPVQDPNSGEGLPRPNKFSDKLAKARVKHREVVTHGIRSLFR